MPVTSGTMPVRVAAAGLGKMGISHLSMARAHPDVDLVAVCDSTGYLVDLLGKYTGLQGYTDYERMLDSTRPDAVVISTPTRLHHAMARAALERGVHVFCEKPLALTVEESRDLATMAAERGLVTQVGYHNRFVASFREVKHLLEAGAIGRVTHALAEAYGPVVLRPSGSTWRSRRSEGGGALLDYAAHPLDLLTWYLGEPSGATGTSMRPVFSREIEDEVYSNLSFLDGTTAHLSVNWSDESVRKMTTRVTLWGEQGLIKADRQECRAYLRDGASVPEGYSHGWNVRNTTELTPPVWFYVRGEEYSAQLDHFVGSVARAKSGQAVDAFSDFAAASVTDQLIHMIQADSRGEAPTGPGRAPEPPRRFRFFRRWRAR